MNVSVEIPKECETLIFNYAKEQNKSVDEVINKWFIDFLEELEDIKDALEARKERENGDKGIPAREYFEKLGI